MTAVPEQSLTLFDRENYLATLHDAIESVEPDHEGEFLEEYARALQSAIAKRDACAWFLATQDGRVEMMDAEIDRLQKLKAKTCNGIKRVERILTRAIEFLGIDASGKYRKLCGHTSEFSLAACPPSIEITSMEELPREFKRVTVAMPAELWDTIVSGFDPDLAARVHEFAKVEECPDKRAIRTALEAGFDIPGADERSGKMRLVRS